MGGLLETQEFALALSSLSGYSCQFITLAKNVEQKIPMALTGLISISYSPFSYKKIVKITPSPNKTIEEVANPWWNSNLSLRLDEEGYLYLTQTGWGSMTFRISSL